MHCAFDAYGTLFDVAAAARQAAAEPGNERLSESWRTVAANWRIKQLSYTWLRAVTGAHADFWQVTCDSLDWAMDAAGLAGDDVLRERLLDLYWQLSAFPEVHGMLSELKRAGHAVAILSNGTPEMLRAAVDAADLTELVGALLSVEEVGVFKPNHSVYKLATAHFRCTPAEILFVSSNGWDAAAAAGFGFRSIWVNRNDEPIERLPWKPHAVVCDLTGIPQFAGSQK
ncbi:MAG: haloacid dehalogenase type II [Rhodobacteraceae bacterium]|nr:haloacid dehalogenase type II [Paracoccaceae bacterium]